MERRTIVLLAAASAFVPLGIVVWSHSAWWPAAWASALDTYVPQGATATFSDFSPSDRTGVLVGDARPIIGAPVYLLFQPRRHTKYVVVDFSVTNIGAGVPAMRIGYRHGDGPEDNVFVPTTVTPAGNGALVSARLPFDEMTIERTDARRIVFEARGASPEQPLYVTRVKLFYE